MEVAEEDMEVQEETSLITKLAQWAICCLLAQWAICCLLAWRPYSLTWLLLPAPPYLLVPPP